MSTPDDSGRQLTPEGLSRLNDLIAEGHSFSVAMAQVKEWMSGRGSESNSETEPRFLDVIQPFIEDSECREFAETIMRRVVWLRCNEKDVQVGLATSQGKDARLVLDLATSGSVTFPCPPSYRPVAEHYRGGSFWSEHLELVLNESFCSGMFCLDEGWNFEQYAPELVAMAGELDIAMDQMNSDHYILHPTEKNSRGEAKVYFMAHDNPGLVEVYPDLGVGGHFLGAIAKYLSEF